MKIELLEIEAYARCRLCGDAYWLTANINIQEPAELETACEAIHGAVMEEARLDGWKGGYCPACVEDKADRIKELEQADAAIREFKDNQ